MGFKDLVDNVRWSMNCAAIDKLSSEGVTMGDVHRFARVAHADNVDEAFQAEYCKNTVAPDSLVDLRTMIFQGHGNIEPEYREVFSRMLTEVAKKGWDVLDAYAYLRGCGFTDDETNIYNTCISRFFADPKVIALAGIDTSIPGSVTPQAPEASVSFNPSAAEAAMNAAAQTAAKARKNNKMAATAPA